MMQDGQPSPFCDHQPTDHHSFPQSRSPYAHTEESTSTLSNGVGYFDLRSTGQPAAGSPFSDTASIDGGGKPAAAIAAYAALEYLPIPVIVLSAQKEVVLANEAMGRLFDLDPNCYNDEEGKIMRTSDVLRGMSVANLGIDMIQSGSPIWINWEEFLDSITAEGSKASAPVQALEANPGNRRRSSAKTLPRLNSANLAATTVLDASVDVVISPHRDISVSSTPTQEKPQRGPLAATMIISVWPLEEVRYFTLTFTNAGPQPQANESRTSARTVTKQNSLNYKASGSSSNTSSSGRRSLTSSAGPTPTSSSMTSPVFQDTVFPPYGPPLRSVPTNTHSLFQKATQLKDAIMNSISMPAYAMWKDESFGIPNKALSYLCETSIDKFSTGANQREFLNQFEVWTEDFKRKLEVDEFPIVELCRSQAGFGSRRVGMRNPKTQARMIFDVQGQPVLDDRTGEFLGGMVIFKDVTEYTKRIAAQIKENEKQFEYIANLVPIMIWRTTAEGTHDWYSQRWYDYTGLSVEESFGEGWMLAFHPDDMVETGKRWEHSLKTGSPYNTEYRCKRYDGQWRWMLGQAVPFREADGTIVKWFGTCTDIHDVVEARQAAKETREQLQRVIEHTHTTLWAVNTVKELTLLEGNMSWRTGDELSENRIEIGKKVDDIFPANEVSGLIDKILSGQSAEESSEIYYPPADRWFRSRLLPSFSAPRTSGKEGEAFVDGVIGMTIDVTEIRKSEQELHEQEKANSQLLANAAAAKEASKMKSQFLANMSHEIRTPIAGVIGMSELLLDTPLDQEQKDCAENINRSANSLLTVINDILDFSKVESGRLDIEEVQFSLSVVIRDVNKMLSYAASRKELSYESDVQYEIEQDFKVIGDPGRLRQILTNLLTNSIKFTSEGSVKLKARIVDESAEVVKVSFEVEDTGIGIEEDVRKRLFTPFSQADSSTARRYGGTGLGLTICKNLVELMHGSIELHSTLGQGTRAVFWIPFNRANGSERDSPLVDLSTIPDRLQSEISVSCGSLEGERTPPPLASPDVHGRRTLANVPEDLSTLSPEDRANTHVLVVEDNQINQQIALKTIKKLGFSVNAVWNGQEALDYLLKEPTAETPRPGIILMDCQMPVMDGLQATEIIRNEEPFASSDEINKIPIVAMTASAIQGDKEKCMEVGMQDYLSKPVRGKVLEKMLLKWAIDGRRKQRMFNTQKKTPPKARRPSQLISSMVPSPASSQQSFFTEPPKSTDTPPPQWQPQIDRSRVMSMDSQSSTLAAELNRISFQSDTALARAKETDNERAMRRLEQEEKALTLRDEKLLAASDEVRDVAATSPLHPSVEGPVRRASLGQLGDEWEDETAAKVPLTYENIKRMEKEGGPVSDTLGPDWVGDLVDGQDDSSHSKSSASRPALPRVQHESERTVTRA